MDNVDGDKVARRIFEFAGAPVEVLRTARTRSRSSARPTPGRATSRPGLDGKEQQANIALKGAQARAALGTATPIAPGLQPAGAK
jgi:hypothetical protein